VAKCFQASTKLSQMEMTKLNVRNILTYKHEKLIDVAQNTVLS